MNWDSLRGIAINNENKDKLDLIRLEFKIMYIIQLELEKYNSKMKLDANNKYGKWNVV